MIPIIIIERQDEKISSRLFHIFSKNYKAVYIDSESFNSTDAECEFLICKYSQIPKLNAKNGLIVFSDQFTGTVKRIIPDGFYGICSCKNQFAMELLENSSSNFVSVGFSKDDQITFSSEDESSLVATINEAIDTFSKDTVFPCDIVMHHTGYESNDLLIFLAILIASDHIGSQTILQIN